MTSETTLQSEQLPKAGESLNKSKSINEFLKCDRFKKALNMEKNN